jgi:hypothetical protein
VVVVVVGELDELATRPMATAATTTTTVVAINHLEFRRMIISPVAYIGTYDVFVPPRYFQRKCAVRTKLRSTIDCHRTVTQLTEFSKYRIHPCEYCVHDQCLRLHAERSGSWCVYDDIF